jgi:hypothetical protein
VQTEGGFLTAVANADGKIVGHVNLQSARQFARGTAALAAFQVASAVTLQYYLHRIDSQLAQIAADVRALRSDTAWATISRGHSEVDVIAGRLRERGVLDDHWRHQLDLEERSVDVVARQELRPVREAARAVRDLRRELADLLESHDQRGRWQKTISAARGTLPGGIRSRMQEVLAQVRTALPHWEMACAALMVHAALSSLQLADEAMRDPAITRAEQERRASLADAAVEQRRLVDEIGGIAALVAPEVAGLYALDGAIEKAYERYSVEHAAMAAVARSAADQMSTAASTRVAAIELDKNWRGRVVARQLGASD